MDALIRAAGWLNPIVRFVLPHWLCNKVEEKAYEYLASQYVSDDDYDIEF